VLWCLLALIAFPAVADITGTWSGSYILEGRSGQLRITLGQIGTAVLARSESEGFSSAPAPGSVDDGQLRIALTLAGGETVDLLGRIDGDQIAASLRTRDGHRGSAALVRELVAAAATDVTGTWSGTLNATEHPCNDKTVAKQWSSPMTLSVAQQQGVVSGVVALDSAPDYDSQMCSSRGTRAFSFPFSGNVSGSTLSGTFVVPKGSGGYDAVSLTAEVTGNTMSITMTQGSDFSGSSTLTQTSTQSPFGALTGNYTGTFSAAIVPCGRGSAVPYSGTVTASLLQAGNAITGSVTIIGDKSDKDTGNGGCTLVDDPPTVHPINATVNGNSVSGTVTNANGKVNPWSGTISGNTITISGTAEFPGEFFNMTITKTTAGGGSPGIPAPSVLSFTATPSSVSAGGTSTLTWATINAGTATIDNGIGTQPASGSVSVTPNQTTTYTLTVSGPGGTATATTTVTVNSGTASIVVGTLPAGMLQAVGGAATTDSFSVSNVGTGSATVTLTANGNFFSVSPSTFTLAPGTSQVVGIIASPQAAGTYDGSVSVSPSGASVPVHLLVASPPTAPVIPQATTSRSDVSAPAGQNPTGSVSFKNNGTGTLTGIAVSDVPWIVPQTGAITIPPGQTVPINFTIDRSRRPDTSSLIGGLAGKISLVFLTNAFSKTAIPLGTTPTGSVSVTIVDVVKPGVAPGTPPPLQPGELAYFIAALRTNNRFNGDLMLSGKNDVPDLKMILSAQNQQQIASLASVPSNTGVAFPAIIRNVFGVTGLGGSLQVRSSQNPNIALAGMVSTNVAGGGPSTITALPILRSDRGAAAGERLVFAGADNSQSATENLATSLYLQEVSGNAGHVSIEYRDLAGNVVGTDSSAIGSFQLFVSDVPAAARTIIVTNDSTGSARISGYAVVTADASGDTWVLVDPRQFGTPSGSLIMPIVAAGSQAEVYVANGSSGPLNVSLDFGSGNRRHSVRAAGTGGQSTPQTLTIGAMSTSRTTLTPANGFVRINAGSGSVSAVGRITASNSGTTIGSSLPAVPSGSALGNGQGRRFTGVDDSSARTVAAATPGTYRSTLMLIEATGQSATVRVTLRYTFVAGATVSSQAVSSHDFVVGPNQVMTISDLARSIIGAQRDAFGDLRNMQVDVDVVGGSGKVLPFMETIDNGSGDIAVRAE
jgi:hypothetical protein